MTDATLISTQKPCLSLCTAINLYCTNSADYVAAQVVVSDLLNAVGMVNTGDTNICDRNVSSTTCNSGPSAANSSM